MIRQPKVELQERIKKIERERERQRQRNKFIKNKIRTKKSKNIRYSNKHQIIQIILYNKCRVTNRSLNPDRIGYGPNKPNTINL